MKSFFLALNFSAILLFVACTPTSSLQPDEVLLNNSRNRIGEPPTSISAIATAPKDNTFSVKETKHLEELIESSQTSRSESREAIFMGEDETPLLNGPFSDALESGLAVKPRENIQVAWPLDIINGYLKVRNNREGSSWIKYNNNLNQAQVILLEDFLIPQVSINDSRLVITPKETDEVDEPIQTIPIAVSSEESKEIFYTPAPTEETDEDLVFQEAKPLDPKPSDIQDEEFLTVTEGEDETLPLPAEPFIDDPIINVAQDNDPDVVAAEPSINHEHSLAPERSPRPKPRPDDASTVETEIEHSHAPSKSPRPKARPYSLMDDHTPLLSATSPSTQELLSSLGVSEASILNETQYLRNGERQISEVFPRAYKHFSACTFNPAQGSAKSRCYKELVLSEEFTDFLEQKGQTCAENAAQHVFEKTPLKVLFKTNGGSLNRDDSTSLHYRGRALDIFKVSLYFEAGSSPREIPFHRNETDGRSVTERQNHTFYWSFQGCWKKEIEEHHRAKSCGGRGRGVLTYTYNTAHHNHMHISLPVCRDLRKRFNLKST
ncbi:MAG: hypothetical protein ACRBBP_08745 [Bdellovibrionales bacterium]